jgi:hypothetical protein
MFRLLGFLVGSLTSALIILLIVGMPTFQLSDSDANQERYDAAIEKLREKQKEFEDVAGRLTDDIARVAESVRENDDVITDDTAPAEVAEALAIVAEEPIETAVETVPQPEPSWYSFWNPFRSEIAANGFVAQLERVTGMDYRVVKVKTGVYEVAFSYFDDDERRTKLSQIAAATGLDLPDS